MGNRAVFAILLVIVVTSNVTARTWRSAAGNFSVEAEYVGYQNGIVSMRKANGTVIQVPYSKLSVEDRDYVRGVVTGRSGDASETHPESKPPEGSVSALEEAASQQRTAANAVAIYEAYLASKPSVSDQQAAETRLEHWKTLASKDMVRLGNDWMPQSEAAKIEDEESRLLGEAMRIVEVGDKQLVEAKLREASQANPHSIHAEFMLGLFAALVYRDSEKAEQQFQLCAKRRKPEQATLNRQERTNLVAAYNNLAIAKVRDYNYRHALSLWALAVELVPSTPELVQNLGRFSNLNNSHPYLDVPAGTIRSGAELYAKVAVATKANKFDANIGWLYMGFVKEPTTAQWITKATSAMPVATIDESMVSGTKDRKDVTLVGGGTGFVVAPNHILTNRHVVEDASAVAILSPDTPDRSLKATVLAISDDSDLALIQCSELEAAPVPITSGTPRLATDIVVLGFPEFFTLGQDLKITRGTISGLPNPRTGNYLLYDAVTNSGNSGGPVFDQTGSVVAVHAEGLGASAFQSLNAGKFGRGVPSLSVIPFLKKHIEGYEPSAATVETSDWADIVENAGKSTVNVLIYEDNAAIDFAKRLAEKPVSRQESNALEDRWCMGCHGHGTAVCPSRGCKRGRISGTVTEIIGRTTTGSPISKRRVVSEPCRNCSGSGRVRCPYCGGRLID